MRLLIVSGFLGSGKTTFIVKAAEKAVTQDIKVAILVNEIGEIGIDDQFMRRLDLNVWEILGGCICCTLAGNLGETLDSLIKDYQPDVVFLEPSGAADLRTIDRILNNHPSAASIASRRVTIVDPLRLDMMMTVITPLITAQIQSADLIVINKTDVATAEQLHVALSTVKSMHPDVPITYSSATDDLDDVIGGWIFP